MDFVSFSASSTPVKVQAVTGLLNGYKINEVIHGGRKINLRPQHYYYVPALKQVVTYKATAARPLKLSKQMKYSFQETIGGGYSKTVQVSASELICSANQKFA